MRFHLIVALLVGFALREARAEQVFVELDDLTAYGGAQTLWLDYRVDGNSWKFLQQRSLSPTLIVSLRGRGRRDVQLSSVLSSREGRITFSLPEPLMRNEVEVSLTGSNGRDNIAWMKVRRMELTRLGLRVQGVQATAPVYGSAAPMPTYA